MTRPLCKTCQSRPAAINYYKGEKAYYRKNCEVCSHGNSGKGLPNWYKSGYRIKNICDKCGFKSQHKEQFNVFHVDGNLLNVKPTNLKTVCANCQRLLHKEGIIWRQGDLRPDL